MVTLRKASLTVMTMLGLCLFVDTSEAASLVLQEGVNGYSGCTDSHVHKNGYSSGQTQNYGDSRDLLFGPESYQSG